MITKRHLLQICNVGKIVGGTAACAWTITRCFPEWRHTVAFLSDVCAETHSAFAHTRLLRWRDVTEERVRETTADFVILHNTSRARCRLLLPIPSLQYLHSRIEPAPVRRVVVCSRWLAERMSFPNGAVLHQGVPRPLRDELAPDIRALRTRPVIGRICTPTPRKWPEALVPFYHRMSSRFPDVDWEFVGCPAELQPALAEACRQRVVFHPASWQARRLYWQWDALLYHHPTLTESFGRTVAEAMRSGCIPIVDSRGGFREQITPGGGYLCEDERGFHEAVAALQSVSLRRQMSIRCCEHADAEFSLSRFRERLLAVMDATNPGSPWQNRLRALSRHAG